MIKQLTDQFRFNTWSLVSIICFELGPYFVSITQVTAYDAALDFKYYYYSVTTMKLIGNKVTIVINVGMNKGQVQNVGSALGPGSLSSWLHF